MREVVFRMSMRQSWAELRLLMAFLLPCSIDITLFEFYILPIMGSPSGFWCLKRQYVDAF